MKKVIQIIPSLLLLIGSQWLYAVTPGPYVGVGTGVSDLDAQSGFIKQEDNGFGGRAFFGYHFNHYFGLEANYSVFEKTRYLDIDYPLVSANYSLSALSLVGKVYIPLTEQFNVYGLIGAAKVFGELDVVYNRLFLGSDFRNGVVPTAGFGMSYDLNDRAVLGLEYSGFGEIKAAEHVGVPYSALATLSLAYKF